MAEQDLDRNETATPYKLQKAREKGQVSKSSDVVSALVFTVAVAYLSWQGWDMALRQFRLDQLLVIQSSAAGPGAEMLWPLIAGMLKEALAWLAPFACTVMIAAVVGNAMQTGPVLSVEPVVADFNRLNPANGIQRVLSMRALFDAARACVKLGLLIAVAYFSLKDLAPQFYSLSGLSPQGYLKTLIADLGSLGFKMALLMAIIAAVDWVFTRREFAKKMRMSKREVKDEHKQREGDPRVRARLRDLQREARKRSKALHQTRNAEPDLHIEKIARQGKGCECQQHAQRQHNAQRHLHACRLEQSTHAQCGRCRWQRQQLPHRPGQADHQQRTHAPGNGHGIQHGRHCQHDSQSQRGKKSF